MSNWTHRICGECWIEEQAAATDRQADDFSEAAKSNPEAAAEVESMRYSILRPTQVTDGEIGFCCFCGQTTRLGIFKRADPKTTKCGGRHGEG